MTDPIKITSLEAENVKRVRAVQLHPSATGLTIIGGNNNQGKTSLLDTIAWALGGDRFRPSMATREGSTIPPHIKVFLSGRQHGQRQSSAFQSLQQGRQAESREQGREPADGQAQRAAEGAAEP